MNKITFDFLFIDFVNIKEYVINYLILCICKFSKLILDYFNYFVIK